MASIYGLYGADGRLRYIGKANDPLARLKSHLRDTTRRQTPLYAWIRKHGSPELRVLEADCVDWREAEKRLIAEARARGDKLLNVADGGDEPHCPEAVRRENGRKVAQAREADPRQKRIWEIKRAIGYALKQGLLKDRHLAAMRLAAQRAPHIFGCWSGV